MHFFDRLMCLYNFVSFQHLSYLYFSAMSFFGVTRPYLSFKSTIGSGIFSWASKTFFVLSAFAFAIAKFGIETVIILRGFSASKVPIIGKFSWIASAWFLDSSSSFRFYLQLFLILVQKDMVHRNENAVYLIFLLMVIVSTLTVKLLVFPKMLALPQFYINITVSYSWKVFVRSIKLISKIELQYWV